MRTVLLLLALALTLTACSPGTTAPRPESATVASPGMAVLRYAPACPGLFWMGLDNGLVGISYFFAGSTHDTTVTAGPHAVSFIRLDGPTYGGSQVLEVQAVTRYTMPCP